MRLIDIRDSHAFELAVEEIHADAIVVQLPTVFVLLAAPTMRGAEQLDRSKTRLPGKNYGTAIGSLGRFLVQADPAHMPRDFSTEADFEPRFAQRQRPYVHPRSLRRLLACPRSLRRKAGCNYHRTDDSTSHRPTAGCSRPTNDSCRRTICR